MNGKKHPLPAPDVNTKGFKYRMSKFKKGHADFGPQPKIPGEPVETGYKLRDGGNYSNGRFPRKVNK